jgi:hypothetical protein
MDNLIQKLNEINLQNASTPGKIGSARNLDTGKTVILFSLEQFDPSKMSAILPLKTITNDNEAKLVRIEIEYLEALLLDGDSSEDFGLLVSCVELNRLYRYYIDELLEDGSLDILND